MSFLFSLPMVIVVFFGMLLTCRNLYLALVKRMGEGKRATAGKVTFVFCAVSAGLIAAPQFFTFGALGYLQYILAAVYLTFLVTGAINLWKVARLVWAALDTNPNNDPVIPGEDKAGEHKGSCGCPGKKDAADGDPSPPRTGKPESK